METIRKQLANYQKKTITLSDLEGIIKPYIQTYEDFSQIVLELEQTKILEMVKSKGRTSRTPSLAFQYRIQRHLLAQDYHSELQHYRTTLHPSINLDKYYGNDSLIWQEDLPYLMKIDDYIKRHSFPTVYVPAPERSYELVGDEKWITEKRGKEVLERVGLYTHFCIIPVSEPLMFAINSNHIHDTHQLHLIVENKTTYHGLLPVLKETNFSTLIYGSGKSIIKSIEQFPLQYPISAQHYFLYFGDLDREGISIWYWLNQKQAVIPALPFYQACLVQEAAIGKGNQQERKDPIEHFVDFFPPNENHVIRSLLKEEKYYPQETLKTKELQQIWRESDWTTLIYKT